jgi:hypothetical protein
MNEHKWTRLQALHPPTVESLPVELDDETLLVRARQLAAAQRHVRDLEEEHKAVRSELRRAMGEARRAVDALRDIVAEGREDRPVKVEERGDFSEGIVYVVRLDTDAAVRNRPMTGDDRQRQIPAPGDDPATDGDDEPLPREAGDYVTDGDGFVVDVSEQTDEGADDGE